MLLVMGLPCHLRQGWSILRKLRWSVCLQLFDPAAFWVPAPDKARRVLRGRGPPLQRHLQLLPAPALHPVLLPDLQEQSCVTTCMTRCMIAMDQEGTVTWQGTQGLQIYVSPAVAAIESWWA